MDYSISNFSTQRLKGIVSRYSYFRSKKLNQCTLCEHRSFSIVKKIPESPILRAAFGCRQPSMNQKPLRKPPLIQKFFRKPPTICMYNNCTIVHTGGFFQYAMKSDTLQKIDQFQRWKVEKEKNSSAAFTTIFRIRKSVHRDKLNFSFCFSL